MKKNILILIILFCFISPFSVAKSQYKGINSFFEGDTIFYSLSNFISSNKIVIVDQKNKIFSTDTEFKHQSKNGEQTLKITNLIPKEYIYIIRGLYY